jgi:hypothetical protein
LKSRNGLVDIDKKGTNLPAQECFHFTGSSRHHLELTGKEALSKIRLGRADGSTCQDATGRGSAVGGEQQTGNGGDHAHTPGEGGSCHQGSATSAENDQRGGQEWMTDGLMAEPPQPGLDASPDGVLPARFSDGLRRFAGLWLVPGLIPKVLILVIPARIVRVVLAIGTAGCVLEVIARGVVLPAAMLRISQELANQFANGLAEGGADGAGDGILEPAGERLQGIVELLDPLRQRPWRRSMSLVHGHDLLPNAEGLYQGELSPIAQRSNCWRRRSEFMAERIARS